MVDVRVGVGPRVAAAAIDLVGMAVAALAAGGVLAVVMGADAGDITPPGGTGELAGLLGFVGALAGAFAAVLGYSFIEGLTGTSPGKRVLHLVVTRDDGGRAPRGRCLARWVVKYAALLLLTLGIVTGADVVMTAGRIAGVVTIAGCALALGEHKRALHDFAAGTAVSRLEPRAESREPQAASRKPRA